MAYDAHSNFAYSTVATAPSPASSGTSVTVAAGDGALFPAVPFNATIWPTGALALSTNAEIVRVTNIAGDVLTITRAQESSSARTVVVGDQIAATVTKKTLTDIEGQFAKTGFTTTTVAGAVVAGTHDSAGLMLAVPGYLTTAMVSAGGSNFVAASAGFNGTNISGTIASNSISLSVAPTSSIVGTSGISISTAGSTVTFMITASNVNGVSFGYSGNSVLTGSVAAQTNQSAGFYAVGNTYSTSTSTTLDARTISFNAIGAASVGFSAGSINVAVPPTSSLVGTFGVGVSTNGSTITVSGWTLPQYEPFAMHNALSTTYAPAIGSIYLQPFSLPAMVSGGRINRLTNFGSTASVLRESSTDFASNTTGSRAVRFQYSNVLGLYSLGAGANSTRLESAWSSMFSLEISHTVSVSSAAGPNMSVSAGATMSYISAINSAGVASTTTTNASSTVAAAASTIGTTAVTAFLSSIRNMLSSQILLPVPVNTTITPGHYWLAEFWSTASSTTGTSGDVLSVVNRVGLFGNTNTAHRNWQATAASSGSQPFQGQGVFSGTSAALPATIAFSDVRTLASQIVQYFNYANSTI